MSYAQVLSLWMWLSLRLGEEAFPGHARAVEAAASMVELMDLGLQALSQRQVTRRTHTSLPTSATDAGPWRRAWRYHRLMALTATHPVTMMQCTPLRRQPVQDPA